MRTEIQRIIESHSPENASIIIELLIEKEVSNAKLDAAIEQVKENIKMLKN